MITPFDYEFIESVDELPNRPKENTTYLQVDLDSETDTHIYFEHYFNYELELWCRKKWDAPKIVSPKEARSIEEFNKRFEEPKDCSYVTIKTNGKQLGVLYKTTDIVEIHASLSKEYDDEFSILYRENITKTQLEKLYKAKNG